MKVAVEWTNLIRSKVIGHGETRQGYKMTSSSEEIGIRADREHGIL